MLRSSGVTQIYAKKARFKVPMAAFGEGGMLSQNLGCRVLGSSVQKIHLAAESERTGQNEQGSVGTLPGIEGTHTPQRGSW